MRRRQAYARCHPAEGLSRLRCQAGTGSQWPLGPEWHAPGSPRAPHPGSRDLEPWGQLQVGRLLPLGHSRSGAQVPVCPHHLPLLLWPRSSGGHLLPSATAFWASRQDRGPGQALWWPRTQHPGPAARGTQPMPHAGLRTRCLSPAAPASCPRAWTGPPPRQPPLPGCLHPHVSLSCPPSPPGPPG